MARSKVDFWVGLFVLLGVLAVIFLALRAGNLSSFSWAPTYTVTADFHNIGGLKPRAAVKSAGVVVGRVDSIDLDDTTFVAVVRIKLEERYEFPTDSSASILTAGLLGEQYIGLAPGAEDKMLEDGGSITYTQSAVVLENLISQFLYGMADKQGTASNNTAAEAAP